MKYLVLTMLVLTCFKMSLRAQTGGVKGIVADSSTLKIMPYTTVALYQKGKLVEGALTDSAGRFAIRMGNTGSYDLSFSAVGYRVLQRKINGDGSGHVVDLGLLKMVQDAKNLKAVTIRGVKPLIEQRADGLTFNVESLPSVAGSDAADVLRKVPLLSVDPNGEVSMRGSTNIRVFIDGKPSDIYASSVSDALKAIRGEHIIRVEVITNPSAKYDSEGTDGVINIITRKSKVDATNGSITGVGSNRSESMMGEVHSKYGKWLFNADAFYQGYRNRNGSELMRETHGIEWNQKTESSQTGNNFFGGANLLYSPDSMNTLNIGYRARRLSNTVKNNAVNGLGQNLQDALFQRDTKTWSKNPGNSLNAGFNYTSGNKRREISLLAIYWSGKPINHYNLTQFENEAASYREIFDSKTLMKDFAFQGDFTQSFNDRWKWEAGGKVMVKDLQSNSRFDVYDFEEGIYNNDAERSNFFKYQSGVYAAYNSVSLKLKKWAIVTGLRYEHTTMHVTFRDKMLHVPSFGNLVPNILVNRIVDDKTSIKLSYTARLMRPHFTFLNPTVNRSDSITIQYGNPYLQPEVTKRYQFSYTRYDSKLFKDFALFFNDNRNSIENIRTALPDGLLESTYKNVGRNQRLGLSATLTWKPSAKLTLGGTYTGQYVWLKSAALGIANAGWMHQLVINSSYKFRNGFSADFYGFFDSKSLRLQGHREGWKYYSITVNKKSTNERINFSLRMDTILTPYSFITEETINEAYRQSQTFRFQNQNVRLSVSFKLGKKEIKSPRMRQVEGGGE